MFLIPWLFKFKATLNVATKHLVADICFLMLHMGSHTVWYSFLSEYSKSCAFCCVVTYTKALLGSPDTWQCCAAVPCESEHFYFPITGCISISSLHLLSYWSCRPILSLGTWASKSPKIDMPFIQFYAQSSSEFTAFVYEIALCTTGPL